MGFPAAGDIADICNEFLSMLQAFVLSFKTGIGNNQTWGGLSNYARLLKDGVFRTAITNNFFYLIIQVPVMLILAIFLACLLNKKELRGKEFTGQ